MLTKLVTISSSRRDRYALVLETAPRRSPLALSVFNKSGLRQESLTRKVYSKHDGSTGTCNGQLVNKFKLGKLFIIGSIKVQWHVGQS